MRIKDKAEKKKMANDAEQISAFFFSSVPLGSAGFASVTTTPT